MSLTLVLLAEVLGGLLPPAHDLAVEQGHSLLRYADEVTISRTSAGSGQTDGLALALLALGLIERLALVEQRLEQVEALVRERCGADGPSVADSLARIADALDPPPPDIVGSRYVADRLGCTTVWVAEMVRDGVIPSRCIVPGTGTGKPWKFFRAKIDVWIESR